jgi:hypothetical protein
VRDRETPTDINTDNRILAIAGPRCGVVDCPADRILDVDHCASIVYVVVGSDEITEIGI